jgi:hypothetical protein
MDRISYKAQALGAVRQHMYDTVDPQREYHTFFSLHAQLVGGGKFITYTLFSLPEATYVYLCRYLGR